MKAIVQTRYGAPADALEWQEIEPPTPKPGQVRLKVRATSINAADYRLIRADPFLVKLERGWRRPKKWPILGIDVAGVVESVGEGVQHLKPGDEVWGDTFLDGLGAFAEYVCVQEDALCLKPPHASFEEAASLPLAGVTALQALRDKGEVRPEDEILIYGAGGGVGNMMVQIARAMGAHVTAVCGPRSADLVAELGAHRILDYTRDDPLKDSARFDKVFGVNGYRPLRDYRRLLRTQGRYVMVGGTNRQIFAAMLFGKLAFLGSSKFAGALSINEDIRARDLGELRDMWTQGEIRPVLDRSFAFEDILQAFDHVERGHVKGKVTLHMT